MLTNLRIQGFKSWADTGEIKLGKLTGFFGPNSSGKTSLLQFLLMLKQTVESSDRSRVLHTGDKNSYVDLGTFYDIIHKHQLPSSIKFSLSGRPSFVHSSGNSFEFQATISGYKNLVQIESFSYLLMPEEVYIGWNREDLDLFNKSKILSGESEREDSFENFSPEEPAKFYEFPLSKAYPSEREFKSGLVHNMERYFYNIYYLGPLREYPGRLYSWAGERPADVGRRGEYTVDALLAADVQHDGKLKDPNTGKAHTVTQHVAYWLKRLELIHSFKLKPIAKNRKEYEVKVKQSASATEVALTDVGFGISQVLPVLTLCFYAPAGSTIIFEQPEIHLHPAVQAGLADVFLDAIKQRGIQIILESHSEHLLNRLQLRIAEAVASAADVNIYFTQAHNGESQLTELDIDDYGNIRNWPQNFFGDTMSDLVQMTQAAMKRKQAERDAK